MNDAVNRLAAVRGAAPERSEAVAAAAGAVRRVAYVLNAFPVPTQTFVANELAELRRRGVAIRILARRRRTEEVVHRIVGEAGLDAIASYDVEEFAGIVEAFRPQLLHAHFATECTALARELAAAHGIPFTFTAHGYDVYIKPPADFAARAAAAAGVITVSEANATHLARTFGVPRARMTVIRNGVDTMRFRPAPGLAPPDEGPGLIVCVARHVPVKNLELLLDALALLHVRGVAFRCVCVGGGAGRPDLEARRGALGLDEVVAFAGELEQSAVIAWWQRASVAVLTSHSEGMPVSLIEAAACGVPAVATAVGGVPELVRPGVTGLLVPPGDAAALAAALARLLADRAQARAMGDAARLHALANHSLAGQVDALLALWGKVLA